MNQSVDKPQRASGSTYMYNVPFYLLHVVVKLYNVTMSCKL